MKHAAKAFLDEIEQFIERAGMSATAFGRLSVKDPCLVGDLRRGRMPGLDIVDRVNRFMRSPAASETGEAA